MPNDTHECVFYFDTEWLGYYCDICTAKRDQPAK